MKREEFRAAIQTLLQRYIEDFASFDSNPHIQVTPATLAVTIVNGSDMLQGIAYSDEAVEEAAAADRAAEADAADAQVRRNPDFYAVKPMLRKDAKGMAEPDPAAIDEVVEIYFK